jgi:hypothetical protein
MVNEEAPTDRETAAVPKKSPIAARIWRTLWRRRTWRLMAGRRGPNSAEVITVFITLGLLCVGCIQAYIYWQQAHLMELSLEQNDRGVILGRGQLEVANRNADIAKNNFDATINQFHLDQRAWLHVFISSDPPQLNGSMPIAIHIANSGKTYAIDFRLCFGHGLINSILYKDNPAKVPVPVSSPCTARWTSPTIIPPTSEMDREDAVDSTATAGLGVAEVEALNTGSAIVWISGEANYKDVFPHSPAHWVTFCYFRLVSNGQVHWTTCKTGNAVDTN